LLESIMDLVKEKNIRDAVVVTGIATLDYCVLHMVMTTGYPAVEHFERWEDKPLEVSCINGTIANGIPHLHGVVSDHEKAYSGHIENGCRILYRGEVVILELLSMDLDRVYNEKGTMVLVSKRDDAK